MTGSLGWKCPVCGSGNAPWVPRCDCRLEAKKPPEPEVLRGRPYAPTIQKPCSICGKPTFYPICPDCGHKAQKQWNASLPRVPCAGCSTVIEPYQASYLDQGKTLCQACHEKRPEPYPLTVNPYFKGDAG